MDCTCTIRNHGRVIEFCPMHKAAPEMLAALEAVSVCSDTCSHDYVHECQIDDALAAARGQEAK